jgi:hypothetical protein
MKVNRTTRKTAETESSSKMPFPEKPVQPPANQGRSREPFKQAELASWVHKAKDLPDIRWDKVQAMRQAIRSDGFDLDVRLSRLGEKLPAELVEYFRQAGPDQGS